MINKKILQLGLTNFLRSVLLKPFYTLNLVVPKPTQVSIITTLACNTRCKHCNLWKNKRDKSKELSTEEYKRIIVKLKRWLGNYYLIFSGGEPTVRKDLPEFISFASNLGLFTAINTNLLLNDKNYLLKIINSGLDVINISLDGINPETHDYVRGRKGSFDRVMENIEFIKKNSDPIKIRIATVISKNNLDEIEELIKWVESDKSIYDITFQAIVPSFGGYKEWDPNWKNKSPLWPKDTKKIDKGMNTIILMKKKGYKISNSVRQLEYMKMYLLDAKKKIEGVECIYHKKNFVIRSKGMIYLCNSVNPMLGNILTDDINLLWKRKSRKMIQKIKKCEKPCSLLNCNFEDSIGTKAKKFLRILKS